VAESRDPTPIKAVELFVGGQRVREPRRKVGEYGWNEKTRQFTRKQWIELEEGENPIEVWAESESGESSKRMWATVTYEPPPRVRIPNTVTYEPPPRVAKITQPNNQQVLEQPFLGLIPNKKLDFVKSGVYLGVHPGSPADKEGIKYGDMLIEFNGRSIRTWSDYKAALRLCRPGDRVKVVVSRVNRAITFPITLVAGKEDD
jgi:hypothetical protein